MKDEMKVLYVYAHLEPKSFNTDFRQVFMSLN